MDLQNLFSGSLKAGEIVRDAGRIAPWLIDERKRYRGHADIVLMPENTASVQKILALAHRYKIPVTPQGGNTGLCGGATPQGGILLLTHRLDAIGAVNTADSCITVGAGAVLHHVQAAAAAAGLYFPLHLASAGSCRIGGNLASNAGGLNVVRYGTARALVLGLEAVLPDGTLLSQLAPLHKNTTGMDFKQLLIGSEGIFGVITAATLKLFPRPAVRETLWFGSPTFAGCLKLLSLLRAHYGGSVSSFELISQKSLEISCAYGGYSPPLDASPWQILCELEGFCANTFADLAEVLVENGFENVLQAASEAQRAQFWRVRENISAAQKARGSSIKHDIALPLAQLAEFIEECAAALQAAFPAAETVLFGHLGDGSLHYNVFLPPFTDSRVYDFENAVNDIVYAHVLRHNGTIAAEHGIGCLKKNRLPQVRSAAEIAVMRAVKRRLDPHNIMNPGKVLPDETAPC